MTCPSSFPQAFAQLLQRLHRVHVLKGGHLFLDGGMSFERLIQTLIEEVRLQNVVAPLTTYSHSSADWKSVTIGCLESVALLLLVLDLVHLVCNSTVDLVFLILVVSVDLEVGIQEISSACL